MPGEHDLLGGALSLAKHDLVTPFSVVQGWLGMVLKGQFGPISESQRKALEESTRSCGRISELLQQMSDLGKLERGELALSREQFDLSATVAELANDMHGGAESGVHLELQGVETPLMVVGDRTRLRDAVKTLLFLIVRERRPGTTVVARCARSDAPAPAALFAVGLPDAIDALLADSHGQLAAEWKHGTGFVLPIARRVFEAHGGSLWSTPADVREAELSMTNGGHPPPRTGLAARIPLAR
jgi:signal transduction histidine kinase